MGSVFSSLFFTVNTGVTAFMFMERKGAGLMIWLSRLLSRYCSGLVLITALTMVNVCNWELVRLYFQHFFLVTFGCSYGTSTESSYPWWEFNNEWPFYFLITEITTYWRIVNHLPSHISYILCCFKIWHIIQDYLIRFTKLCDKPAES